MVVAYILNLNGIVAEDAVMNSSTLPTLRMPNRDGFIADPRPDVGPTKAKKPRP
jgi:S-disulfanyl-L-cysteine oxidoreductase SoxD